jgi:hypothetical protein
MAGGQFTRGQNTGSRSQAEQTISETHRWARLPSTTSNNITHGYVTEVNDDVRQVKVKSLGSKLHMIAEGAWLPVLQEEDEIQRRWGQLRQGMFCRVFWVGMGRARRVLYTEILGRELLVLKKQPRANDIPVNPYKFLGGGMDQ